MAGFVKFYRETLDHPVVHKDNDYYVVWSYLLLNANFEEGITEFNGKLFTVKPGQMIRGRKQISEKCKVNESKIERILKRFENEQMIEQQTTTRKRLITILNWKDYQITEQQSEQFNEQQMNNKRTTSEQQLNTNKNNKEVLRSNKNEKKKDIDVFIEFANGDAELLEALMLFEQMRIDKKKPMTPGAQKLLVNKLIEFRNNGEDIVECLKTSVINSWLSVYPSKDKKNSQFAGSDSKSGSRALDMLREMEMNDE